MYAITADGKVFKNGKELSLSISDTGYVKVSIEGRSKYLHHLVLETFVGPRPTNGIWHASHLDGNKLNNSLSNLAWCTAEDNMAHKKLHGTEGRSRRKLDAEKVRALKLKAGSITNVELASEFGITIRHTYRILAGHCWKNVIV
jgi:hypothetical protein